MHPSAGKMPPPFISAAPLIYCQASDRFYSQIVGSYFGGIYINKKYYLLYFAVPFERNQPQMSDRRNSLVVQSVPHTAVTLSDDGLGCACSKRNLIEMSIAESIGE